MRDESNQQQQMDRMRNLFVIALMMLATGCATQQGVTLAKVGLAKPITSVVLSPQADNSQTMDSHIRAAVSNYGIRYEGQTAANSRTSPNGDAVIAYSDVWRWDLVMYLKSVSIQLYDAKTGDLLVIGDWSNSAFHGFQDARVVVQSVVDDMLAKLNQPRPAAYVASPPADRPAAYAPSGPGKGGALTQ